MDHMTEREKVARWLDPDAWRKRWAERGGIGFACFGSEWEREQALQKADALVANSLARADALLNKKPGS